MYRFTLTKILTLSALLFAGQAAATNGYFTHGKGAKNKGSAGAGVAQPSSAIDIANNPASAALVGNRFDFGISAFSPQRSYSTTASQANGSNGAFTIGPNRIDSAREGFLIPNIARSWDRGSHAFGLAFYGRGGMNTAWQGGNARFDPDGPGPAGVTVYDGTYGAGAAGVDLSQALLELVYARKQSTGFSWGVSAVVAIQRFEATGLASFAPYTRSFATSGGTVAVDRLSNRGHELSYGGGFKFGFNSLLTPRLRLAASYQTRLRMTEFDNYADLFAENGDFDIPASLSAGLSFIPTESVHLYLDVEHTWFSDVASVGNPVSRIFDCPTAGAGGVDVESCLGGQRGAGFGWNDVTAVKVGAQWRVNDDWTWRTGVSYAEQPISSSEATFNILAPGVTEVHFTAGFTRQLTSRSEITAALMYAPEKSVTGPNTFDPSQQIQFQMRQLELEVGYGWRF